MSMIVASIGIVTSLVGWAGILLNNRGFLVLLPVMGVLRLPRDSRLHRLREADFQLGRKAQQPVVAEPWCCRSTGHPESARVLWILQPFRVGHDLAILLCEEHSPRLQGPLHAVRAYRPATVVHRRFLFGIASPHRDDLVSPMFEPRHISVREGDGTQSIPPRFG